MGEEERDATHVYLEVQDILALYAEIFGCTESEAADELRNRSGLEAAINRPRTYSHYQRADLSLQAAVLAHGIAEGQHFIDGNKRTALVALRTFLLINGYQVSATQEERAGWIVGLSQGETAEQLAERIRDRLVPADPQDRG